MVFCNSCKYYEEVARRGLRGGIHYEDSCMYSDNIIIKNNWYNQSKCFKKSPAKINKKNDCTWYLKDDQCACGTCDNPHKPLKI